MQSLLASFVGPLACFVLLFFYAKFALVAFDTHAFRCLYSQATYRLDAEPSRVPRGPELSASRA